MVWHDRHRFRNDMPDMFSSVQSWFRFRNDMPDIFRSALVSVHFSVSKLIC